jgi:hypothetical protein
MVRTEETVQFFGPTPPIGEWDTSEIVSALQELNDQAVARELLEEPSEQAESYGLSDWRDFAFKRFVRTDEICGFLGEGTGDLVALADAKGTPEIANSAVKVTLDAVHIARYPGLGTHRVLLDFALQAQDPDGHAPILHFSRTIQAKSGETAPVRNLPLFHGFVVPKTGLTIGFQTVNVGSRVDDGLLEFLGRDEFKSGLALLGGITPVVGQVSCALAALASWLARQSANVKVQEFLQGLDFQESVLGGRISEGHYVVVQIPRESKHEWDWSDWKIDRDAGRVVPREATAHPLDYNHVVFGIHRI